MTRRLALAVALLASAACGGEAARGETDVGASSASVELRAGSRTRIDIGGYALAIRCTGRGAPTVVLEAGYGLPSAYWSELHRRVPGVRVCSYDRAGLGRSDRRPGDADVATPAEELHVLLRRAGVRPPLVLVGHSYGGLLVRVYEATYRGQVRGLVLLDSIHPEHVGSGYVQEGRSRVDAGEMVGRVEARGRLGLPLVVVERGRNRDPAWSRAQRSLGQASSNSVHAIALASYHSIHQGQPAAVVKAIAAVTRAGRRGGRLPSCVRVFAGERVRCLRSPR